MKVTIERLGHLGDGIGPGPIYVSRALPTEVAEGNVEAGRMETPRILMPSPARVTAPCPHYRGCGGCAVMHASDAFVAEWKMDVVRRALAAHALDAEIAGIETSPPGSRRRAVFSGRRLKSGALVGFHARSSDTIRGIPGCRILRSEIIEAIPALEEIVTCLGRRKSEMRLTVTHSDGGIDLLVGGAREMARDDAGALAEIAERFDLARLTVDGELIVTRRPPVRTFGRTAVVPPPSAFLQATSHAESVLTRHVRSSLEGARHIVDLFSGCGTFSLPMAEISGVTAVEADGDMLDALSHGWRHGTGLKPVDTVKRDLFRRPLADDDLFRFDAAIIDPPRAGAEAQIRALSESRIARIVSISCNPVTFARDAAILAESGFTLGPITVVDQFRWSAHIELVATFSR